MLIRRNLFLFNSLTRIVDGRCLNLSPLTLSPKFAAAEAKEVIEQNASSAAIENKSKFDAGIEELIKDFRWNTQPVSVSEIPLKNVKNDMVDLFGEVLPLTLSVRVENPQVITIIITLLVPRAGIR